MDGGIILQRSLCALLLFYALGVVMSLLAGGTLIAHVNPVSKCILFTYQEESKLYYGSEFYCHLLGYSYILLVIIIFVQIYFTFKHRREISKCLKYAYKSSAVIKIPRIIISLHIVVTVAVLFLTIFITAGYGTACHNLSSYIRDFIHQKYYENQADVLREDSLSDTDLEDDQQFWRYVGEIQNAFGGEIYDTQITCGNVLTDPDIYKALQKTHYQKYAGYYGYWYHQDIYSFNSQAEATITNGLIDGCLAGAWLSAILWIGSFIFILVQRRKLEGDSTETDRISVHSASSINTNIIRRGSLGGSSNRSFYQSHTEEAITASRRDLDSLALESLHLPKETSTFLPTPQRGDIQRPKQQLYTAGDMRRGSSGSYKMAPQTSILKTAQGELNGLNGNKSGSTGSHIGSHGNRSGSTGSHIGSYGNRRGSIGSHAGQELRYSNKTGSLPRSSGYRRGSAGSNRHTGNDSWETEIM